MSKPMTADQTLAALKKWKVNVKEYPGWRLRGRPGGVKDARGVVVHHTGSSSQTDDYLNFLFVRGRPEEGIPGPLCNVSTDMDGDLHLGAYGRANHAGTGSLRTLNHVTNEDYGYSAELEPGSDQSVNGNDYYYGNEIRYTGANAMTPAAYETALRHAAAICDFYGWSAMSVIGHKEHTSRKNDPGHQLMHVFRADLAKLLKAGPGGAQGGPVVDHPGKDLAIHAYSVWYAGTQPEGMNKTDEVWGDAYQVMEFAANPKIGVITIAQRDAWVENTVEERDWVDGNKIFNATVKLLQKKWGIATTGEMDARTTAWFRGYGYTII